jgi:hypothetical protein
VSTRSPSELAVPRRALWALAVVAFAVAVTAPGWAGPAARSILVVVAAVIAATGAALLAAAVPFAGTSRFEPVTNKRGRREVPPELESLTRAITQSNAPDGKRTLDPLVVLHLRRVATARLGSRRLDVNHADDLPAIRAVVSDDMWAVLRPGPTTVRGQHLPSLDIASGALPALLDELERL